MPNLFRTDHYVFSFEIIFMIIVIIIVICQVLHDSLDVQFILKKNNFMFPVLSNYFMWFQSYHHYIWQF